MEWVETTGKTVHDAKEAALDVLGVHGDDAEFEVIAEARTGLFGRVKDEARVRARVRPTTPRAKDDRRRRRRGSGGKGRGGQGGQNSQNGGESRGNKQPAKKAAKEAAKKAKEEAKAKAAAEAEGQAASGDAKPSEEG